MAINKTKIILLTASTFSNDPTIASAGVGLTLFRCYDNSGKYSFLEVVDQLYDWL